MRFEVRLTLAALADLEEIVDWIAQHDDPARADHVLERIEAAIGALAAEAVSEAILRAVKKAKSVPGFPSYGDISK